MSQLTKSQKQTFRADYTVDGKPETLIVNVRYDDECGNGHNTFSITGEVYGPCRRSGEAQVIHSSGKTLWLHSCGCIHEIIAKRLPKLAPYIKWHLCSSDGPLHYIANTTYHAGDRDYWGLRKGEARQHRDANGRPLWKLSKPERTTAASKRRPASVVLTWEPDALIGEGKERDLEAARRTAVWPEATDEELTADDLEERLKARLPALLAEFRAAIESLGFTF